MERFVKGDVLVVPFPFTNQNASKKRPALVVARLKGDDLIILMISSKIRADKYSVSLADRDFKHGELPLISEVRVNRVTTIDQSIVLRKIGSLKSEKVNEIISKLIQVLQE